MHWIDIIIVAVITLSVITGLFRGFIKELIALSIWIIAIWLAIHYNPLIDPWLIPYVKDANIRKVLDFVIILLATLIAGGITNAALGFILKHSGLSSIDRLLGMIFGFIRGIFIVSVIIVMLKITNFDYDDKTAKFPNKFTPIVNWLYHKLPKVIQQVNSLDTNHWFNAELELS